MRPLKKRSPGATFKFNRTVAIILYCTYVILVPIIFLAAIEGVLWFLDFPVLARSDYPGDPENFVKIAIFGESSVVGHNSERPFETLLRLELSRQFPGKPIYIRNYGRAGFLFHTYEAEILKNNIDRYDIFLVYAGHGEVHHFLDETGFWRKPEFKNAKMFVRQPGDEMSSITRFLDSHSRLYAYASILQAQRFKKYEESKGGSRREVRFAEFENKGILPPEEVEKINTHFREDLDEISSLATRHNKQIIISSVPSHEEDRPFFSVLPEMPFGIRQLFMSQYKAGLEKYSAKRWDDALHLFEAADGIQPHVAIIEYNMGMCQKFLNHFDESRRLLRAAMQDDGFPARALYSLYDIARNVAQKNPAHVHFVDTIATFHRLVDRGYTYDDLFADFQHPNFLGHMVIGLNFLCELFKIEPFRSDGRGHCTDASEADMRTLAQSYWRELGVPRSDTSAVAMNSAIWHYSLSSLSAYPDDFLDKSEKMITRFWENSDKAPDQKKTYFGFLEMIKQRRISRHLGAGL